MMKKEIDARGLSCPQPVLLTNKAIDVAEFPITVRVDNATAKENVRRMAEGKKLTVKISQDGEDFLLLITK